MTKTKDLAALQASGEAKPLERPRSRKEMLLLCADAFRSVSAVSFGVLYDIELLDEQSLRRTSTKGTALEPVMQHLNALGYDLPDDTVGSFMDVTQVTQDELDSLVCYCTGQVISGTTGALRFRMLADGKPIPRVHTHGLLAARPSTHGGNRRKTTPN